MNKEEKTWVRPGMPVITAPENLRQEDCELKASPETMSRKRRGRRRKRERKKKTGHKLFTE